MNKVLFAFDLDDTLYKEKEYVDSGRRAVAAAAALQCGSDGDSLMHLMADSPDPLGAVEKATGGCLSVEEMVEIYRYHQPRLMMDENTEQVLKELKERGYDLAVITDGSSRRQRLKMEALGLADYIPRENWIISEETGSDKNSSLPFERAEKMFPGYRRVYVGDNPEKDFRYPNLRGWHTAMLADLKGENVHPQTIANLRGEFKAQTVLTDISQLLKYKF